MFQFSSIDWKCDFVSIFIHTTHSSDEWITSGIDSIFPCAFEAKPKPTLCSMLSLRFRLIFGARDDEKLCHLEHWKLILNPHHQNKLTFLSDLLLVCMFRSSPHTDISRLQLQVFFVLSFRESSLMMLLPLPCPPCPVCRMSLIHF